MSVYGLWFEVVFFFQAEDGIRDIGVTGVQTCALPIYTQEIIKVAFSLKKEIKIFTRKLKLTNEVMDKVY